MIIEIANGNISKSTCGGQESYAYPNWERLGTMADLTDLVREIP